MAATALKPFPGEHSRPPRVLASQAISRALGAFPTSGNRVGVLRDAAENYSAWLSAIGGAQRTVLFENYFVHADGIGREFSRVLAAKARQGVAVRLIYDWAGSLGRASALFWRPLRAAGVQVRCFNPPTIHNPLSWVHRDHRKMLVVDGAIGFVAGLCVGGPWIGDRRRGIEPWRDTGLQIQGPALADLELAFYQMWTAAGGDPYQREATGAERAREHAGGVSLRVVATAPNSAHIYRFDQLIAAIARKNLWLTDAYFVGTAPYTQALKAAARDGVDVRLLLPRSSDLPTVQTLSRSGYRHLLEAGVRVFEWNGPMLHAKTAVADGYWARVGSSNMNLASWIGNWELDIVVEHDGFATQMEEMYLDDLGHATEIVLSETPVRTIGTERHAVSPKPAAGKAQQMAGRFLHFKARMESAGNQRVLGPAEARVLGLLGGILILLGTAGIMWPMLLSGIVAGAATWVGASLLIRVCALCARSGRPRAGDTAIKGRHCHGGTAPIQKTPAAKYGLPGISFRRFD